VRCLAMPACLPTATSAYILSRQLGGNAPMMARIIAQTQFDLHILNIPRAADVDDIDAIHLSNRIDTLDRLQVQQFRH